MKTTNKVSSLIALVVSGYTAYLSGITTLAAETPQKFMGVGTCSSSNCHGSATARTGSNILQNEYYVWTKHDKHAKAYSVLLNEDSKRMAGHLGLKAAHEEPLCLACHATYVPDKKLHGEKFSVEDGVSCESCHGAAGGWLESHATRGTKHKDNLARGLRDIASGEERAKLCLSCHYGNDEKMVDHRLYGAGHPRLTFELDTYSALEPAHWSVDQDYVERKGSYSPVKTWLAGQFAHANAALDTLTNPKLSKKGQFPELSLFDCNSCHHDLPEDQWKKREYGGRPGELHLNLPALAILREVMQALGDGGAAKFSKAFTDLHSGYNSDGGKGSIPALRALLSESTKASVLRAASDLNAQKRLLNQLVTFCGSKRFLKYEVAEQVAMGIQAIFAEQTGGGESITPRLQGLYEALKNSEAFEPEAFTRSCRAFGG